MIIWIIYRQVAASLIYIHFRKEKNGLLCQDEDWKPFSFKIPYYMVKFGTLVEYSLRST